MAVCKTNEIKNVGVGSLFGVSSGELVTPVHEALPDDRADGSVVIASASLLVKQTASNHEAEGVTCTAEAKNSPQKTPPPHANKGVLV